ncbi:MAG: hypothetical protein ACK553_03005 [Planctomycetota bacterium]|jgi:hypothetical protein
MLSIRNLVVLFAVALLVGCGGDAGSKKAIPAGNAAPKPPGAGATGDAAAPATAIDAAE